MQQKTAISPALAATASATELTPTPLAAALSQSGITLPIPFLDLSAKVIRDLPLENVSALQRFIAEAKSELATLAAMLQTGLEMRYADEARAQLLAKGQDNPAARALLEYLRGEQAATLIRTYGYQR